MKKLISTLFIVPALLAAGVACAAAPEPAAGGPPGAGAPGAGGPGGGGITPELVLQNNDENKDGVITKEEATKAARNLIQRWDAADLNKDNKVDAEELKKWVAAGAPGGTQGAAPAGAPGAAAGGAPAGAPRGPAPGAAPPAAAPPAAK